MPGFCSFTQAHFIMDVNAEEKIITKADPNGLGLFTFLWKHCVGLVLVMIDSSDLEVAAGLVRNARVFYHHGQAWKGAES